MIDVYSLIGLAATLLACGFALVKGDQVERMGAIAVFVAGVGTLFAQQDTGNLTPRLVFLAIDTALFTTLVVLLRKTPRSWPLFALAFQMIKIVAHGTALAGIHIGAFAYMSALNLADYGVMATLAVGTWNAWRERDALSYTKP